MYTVDNSYRRDIDGLRALAVSSVVCYHAFPEAVPGGYTGVDVFFVISGFLITGILLGSSSDKNHGITDFYARRIRRLFPALFPVLILTLVTGWFVFLSDEFKTLGNNTLASSLYLSNIFQWKEANYFDITSEYKPLLHLWSLAVEEQFYFFWPVALYFLSLRKQRLTYFILLLIIASFGLCLGSFNNNVSRFYLPHNRFWELLIGALLTQQVIRNGCNFISPNVRATTGLILIITAIFVLDKHSTFPGWAALLPTVGAFLILSAENAWLNTRLLASKPAAFIGLISYSFYLWHWPVLAFVRVVHSGEIPVATRIACVLMSFLLASLTYQFIEKRWRPAAPRRAIMMLLVMSVIGIAGYLIGQGIIKPRSVSSGIEHIQKEIDEWEMPHSDQDIEFQQQHFIGQGNLQNAVMFIGDSNMAQYAARINLLVSRQPKDAGRGAIFATVGGCMPVPGVGRSDNENCLAFMRSSFAYAEQNPHITTVIIAALWVSYFYSPGVFQLHLQTQEQIDVATHNEMALAILEKDIRTLVASGKQVYIIGCLPADRRLDPRQLFSRSAGEFRLNTAVTNGVARNELGNIEIINNQLAAMASQSGAIMINPFDYFCTSSRCPLFSSDGQMIYKDANHLTVNYVRNHVPFFDGLY